jgi:hypothetical protein
MVTGRNTPNTEKTPMSIEQLENELYETPLIVADVALALDGIECGYRIVELTDGRHAFIWGNISAQAGDRLPRETAENPTEQKGINIHPLFEDCVADWREVGEALRDSFNAHTANEVLSAIAHLT